MNIELQYTSPAAAIAYEGKEQGETGPAYGSLHAAAFDLRAIIDAPIELNPGDQINIGTGIKLNMRAAESALPTGVKLASVILPRSGRGTKEGLCIANTVGLIDEDFQGEISFTAWARPFHANGQPSGKVRIEPGERIGQLMFVFAPRPGFTVVSEFSSTTERGEGGFGSTGKQ